MVKTSLSNPFGRAPVFYKDITGSTMADILTLREWGHGTVIFAGYQEQGRGRGHKRTWMADRGRNLLMTLQLTHDRIVHPFYQVPLLTGLGIARFLEDQYGLEGAIKWPNDVLVEGKKISGILCESRGEFISVGIGLNCEQRDFHEELEKKSTSLALLSDLSCHPEEILPPVLEYLKESYEDPRWQQEITRRLFFLDREVTFIKGAAGSQERETVVIRGLSSEGFLLAEDTSGGHLREIMAGEILFPGYRRGQKNETEKKQEHP